MVWKSFKNSKNKFRKTWERFEKNNNEIKNKDNSEKLEFFTNLLKQQNIKVPVEIYNSGKIIKTPSSPTFAFTAFKSEKMPITVGYTQAIDLQIPEDFLPFVKYSIEVNSIPDSEIHLVYEYDPSTWTGDGIEIRGDGTLIYKNNDIPRIDQGFILIGKPLQVLDNDFFISTGISLDLTKKVFKGTLVVDDGNGGNIERIGNVTEIIAVVDNTEAFRTGPWKSGDVIVDLTNTEFTAIGTLTVNGVSTKNIQKTYNFSNLESYSINFTEFAPLFSIASSSIITQKFEPNGLWLFWSTKKERFFSINIIQENDGDFQKIFVQNLPNINFSPILPYTNITVKRNVDNLQTQLKQSSGEELLGVGVPPSTNVLSSIQPTGREYKNYLKISPSNASIPTYRFNLNGSFIIVGKSTSPKLVLLGNPNPAKLFFDLVNLDQRGVNFSGAWQVRFDGFGPPRQDRVGLLHKVTHAVISGNTTTVFTTQPGINSSHKITDIDQTGFTAIGDETITTIVDGIPIVIANTGVNRSLTWVGSSSFSIIINETVNFPVYDFIYTQGEQIFEREFTDGDLSLLNTLNIISFFVVENAQFIVTDNTGSEITPDEISTNGERAIINLSSFRPLTGTWNLTIIGDKYELTTENRSIFAKQIWQPETSDVAFNIKAHLVNPLYWREQRKYNK